MVVVVRDTSDTVCSCCRGGCWTGPWAFGRGSIILVCFGLGSRVTTAVGAAHEVTRDVTRTDVVVVVVAVAVSVMESGSVVAVAPFLLVILRVLI